jgi:vacuolar-type H+-ATPase subunit C/Vma6
LFKIKFKYNGLDEKYFYEFIKKLVGAINLRVFLRLKLEDDENLFKDFFISYGDFSREFFENLSNMNNKELFNHIKKTTGVEISCLDDKCFYIVDKYYNQVKKNFNQYLSKVGFSSPFYILKFLFAFEENMGKIRTLLKSKLLGVNNEEIKKMLSLED